MHCVINIGGLVWVVTLSIFVAHVCHLPTSQGVNVEATRTTSTTSYARPLLRGSHHRCHHPPSNDERGYDAILTFVCHLSKYAYYIPCKSTMMAEEFADIFLRVIVAHHGMPKKIISNRNSRFTSKFWRSASG